MALWGKDTDPMLKTLEPFMVPADINTLNCVDERQSDGVPNGVEIPGGIFGVVDAVKTLNHLGEDEAWSRVVKAGIPLGAHVDDHHAENGCGYANLVETNPKAVYATEAISAKDRIKRLRDLGGSVVTYQGHHKPTHAVINLRHNVSFDPDAANGAGLGIFNFDKWATEEFARRLKINPNRFANHLEQVYRSTVTTLTGMKQFITIK